MALEYDYKADYKDNLNIKKVAEGHAKYEQCMYVVNEIMSTLNTNKYSNIEDFFEKNNSLQDFLKNNPKIQTAIKHVNTFGNPINEEDYVQIKNRLNEITKLKQSFETEDIKTTNIDNKQYNSLNIDNTAHYIDNSYNNKDIEEQMRDIQSTQKSFQNTDAKKNTENMFKEIENKQESIDFQKITEINQNFLNDEEKELFNFAIDYQLSTPSVLKVDLKKALIVDEQNNIMKMVKENGEIKIMKDEKIVETEESIKETESKGYQKQYKPNTNTIYSN